MSTDPGAQSDANQTPDGDDGGDDVGKSINIGEQQQEELQKLREANRQIMEALGMNYGLFVCLKDGYEDRDEQIDNAMELASMSTDTMRNHVVVNNTPLMSFVCYACNALNINKKDHVLITTKQGISVDGHNEAICLMSVKLQNDLQELEYFVKESVRDLELKKRTTLDTIASSAMECAKCDDSEFLVLLMETLRNLQARKNALAEFNPKSRSGHVAVLETIIETLVKLTTTFRERLYAEIAHAPGGKEVTWLRLK